MTILRRFSILLLLLTTLSMTACSSAWWQNFKSDPIASVTRFEQQIENFLNTAIVIFQTIKPLLGSEKLPAIEQTFHKTVLGTRHALAVLNDAVLAAVEAKKENPDFSKLMADVIAAVGEVSAFVDEMKNGSPRVGYTYGGSAGFDELHAQKVSIDRFGKTR